MISPADDNQQGLSVFVMHVAWQPEPMFLVDCPVCGHRELRSARALLDLANTPDGVVYTIACHRCGTAARTVTGRLATRPAAQPAA